MRKYVLHAVVILFFSMFFSMSCQNKIEKNAGSIYDPGKPVKLTTFYPDSGKYQEKVLLTGENFGSDPSIIKVYFNSKQAPVIGSDGSHMYVTAPRLPGDTCTISVVIESDSVTYLNKHFLYKSSVSVTTVVGNGTYVYQDGDLASATLRPYWICMDNDENLFVAHRAFVEGGGDHLARINEESNELVTIQRNLVCGVLAANLETGMVLFSSENSIGEYVTLDPRSFWAPKYYTARWTKAEQTPLNPWNPASILNSTDGSIYTHFFNNGIMKVNPQTWEAELIYPVSGAVNGITFRANEPNILYVMMRGTSSYSPNTLFTMDVTDPEGTFKRLNTISAAGHRDGAIEEAQFNDVRMMISDSEGNIYMADSKNHCIRRLTPDNMVETVLGIPGRAGWKDGGKEDALFNDPTGIAVDPDGTVYVADHGNGRVRKLSIN